MAVTAFLYTLASLFPFFLSLPFLAAFHLRPVTRYWLKFAALWVGKPLGQTHRQFAADREFNKVTAVAEFVDFAVVFDRIRFGRKIDAFETSILPYEDCCTVFTPKHPKTRPTLELCEEAEKNLKIDELIEKAIADTEYTFID